MSKNEDVRERTEELLKNVRTLIEAIETHIKDPYSAEGFYTIFAAGFLPTPYIWAEQDEFEYAMHWKTKPVHGSVKAMDKEGNLVSAEEIAHFALTNIPEIEYRLTQRKEGIVI